MISGELGDLFFWGGGLEGFKGLDKLKFFPFFTGPYKVALQEITLINSQIFAPDETRE